MVRFTAVFTSSGQFPFNEYSSKIWSQELYMCTKISEVNLSIYVYRLFREAFTPLFRTEESPEEWSESFTKQPLDKYR